MKFQPAHLFALALMPVLTLARPSLQIDIKEVGTSQVGSPLQQPMRHAADECQPKDGLCMSAPFNLPCCSGYECDAEPAGKCVAADTLTKSLSKDDDVHAMCRTEGEFCQLVPLAMACCGNMRCTSIFGGKCEKW